MKYTTVQNLDEALDCIQTECVECGVDKECTLQRVMECKDERSRKLLIEATQILDMEFDT